MELRTFMRKASLQEQAWPEVRAIAVKSLQVDTRGVKLRVPGGAFRHEMSESSGWSRFWPSLGGGSSYLDGIQATIALILYDAWVINQNAPAILEKLQSGYTFHELRREHPKMLQHPLVQAELAQQFSAGLPKLRRGKRAVFRYGAVSLYAWASWFYARDHLTWADACEKALNAHPHMIPSAWRKEIPNWLPVNALEALQKEARKLDDLRQFSQQTFRQQSRVPDIKK
ncbi:MAG: hypothetical protein ACSLFJ_06375 [Immundisolibacter sp.]|uniref:hypothetical protein n=1 Tax=Immundisolibacter sp. TaxID=1934948 RepID=UPI003EDF6EB1